MCIFLNKKRSELQAEMVTLKKDNEPKIEKIRKQYQRKIAIANREMAASSANGISQLQNSLWLKLLLDIGNILGYFWLDAHRFR